MQKRMLILRLASAGSTASQVKRQQRLADSPTSLPTSFTGEADHDSTKVPVILAGGLGGSLETGRVLDYTDQGDENRKLCSTYLSIMDRMGVKLDRFVDADTGLAGL